MGVGFGDAAVGGPAGVADAGGAAGTLFGDLFDEVVHATDLAGHVEPAVLLHGDARGIIAAILQAFEALEQNWGCFLTSDVTYDSTHNFLPV